MAGLPLATRLRGPGPLRCGLLAPRTDVLHGVLGVHARVVVVVLAVRRHPLAPREGPRPVTRGPPLLVAAALLHLLLLLLHLHRPVLGLLGLYVRVLDGLVPQQHQLLLPVLVGDQVLPAGFVVLLDLPHVPPPHSRPVHLDLPAHGVLPLGRPVVARVWGRPGLGLGQELELLPRQVDLLLVPVLVLDKVLLGLVRVAIYLALEPLPGLAPVHGHLPPHDLRAEDAPLLVPRLPLPHRVARGRLLLAAQELVDHGLVPVPRLHPVRQGGVHCRRRLVVLDHVVLFSLRVKSSEASAPRARNPAFRRAAAARPRPRESSGGSPRALPGPPRRRRDDDDGEVLSPLRGPL
mmetsp:Transcript_2773/g.7594  ORF Transcript_2773/g.7594 Transcript_2773/m.7594 type:complete len:349 (-) Transcript_2773:256-1302(-)